VILLVLFDSKLRVPGVLFNLAEELVAAHHFRGSSLVMLQVYEFAVTILFTPIRQFFREYVGMAIDLQHIVGQTIMQYPEFISAYVGDHSNTGKEIEGSVPNWPEFLLPATTLTSG
jgi:hypothetical protein